ncbi:MAG: dihydrolipoamide acetyltransferase family protein [Bacillota bacterium]|nr:dihydrolipoamide acetyltransferase family protein [Bacillota bacterium]
MATAVIMPRQGQSVESCIIGRWHVSVGDRIAEGDTLFTYETDKATFDERAQLAGTLLAIFFEEGEDVPVLTTVAVIGEEGEDIAAFRPAGSEATPTEAAATPPGIATTTATQTAAVPVVATTDTDAPVSPRARAAAERGGVDLAGLAGSGPGGRVIERDVQAAHAAGRFVGRPAAQATPVPVATPAPDAAPAPPATEPAAEPATWTEPDTRIRQVIATQMHRSLSEMAQLTLHASFDATAMLALRRRLRAAAADGLGREEGFTLTEQVPTINDLLLYAVSRVLPRHPRLNANYESGQPGRPGQITFFRHVQLGVAVDTERGLMVPTLRDADRLSLGAISSRVRELAAACQTGEISPDLLTGGSFTVTNLGTLGVEQFTPVINPPQTGILGVGTLTTGIRDADGSPQTYPRMGLSLTFDHRAVDGAPAARFLQDLTRALTNIDILLWEGV